MILRFEKNQTSKNEISSIFQIIFEIEDYHFYSISDCIYLAQPNIILCRQMSCTCLDLYENIQKIH